jgi:hypothetical protein
VEAAQPQQSHPGGSAGLTFIAAATLFLCRRRSLSTGSRGEGVRAPTRSAGTWPEIV